ncbi:MAG: metallophosphoesterase family protein [Acutalibacteraceae bacterium]
MELLTNHKTASALIIVLIVILIICITLAVLYYFADKIIIGKTQIQNFDTGNSSLKVGVISDTQLPPTEGSLKDNDSYVNNLKNALTVMKNNDVDLILFAGDIGDLGTYFAFETYEKTIDEVYGENRPIVQTIMGNHDFWNKDAKTAINHLKAFKKVTGSSPWTHYVVNGYHFIGASPNCGSMEAGYVLTSRWLEKELETANADSQGKPIFVMTHNQPFDTCYGSDEWGDKTLNEVLEKYPNVVNLSGHSHYSILDERSIWQGEYTVLSTQSLSYTELETGKENGTVPPNADKTPMGYIMDFTDSSVDIHRINFSEENMGKEEKADKLWSLPLPYTNDERYSFDSRKELNAAPVITDTIGTAATEGDKVILSFNAGTDDDFVHSYKVVIDGKETKYFFSDFYNGVENMSSRVTLELEKAGDSHTYDIYAIDSWGKESKDCIHIG